MKSYFGRFIPLLFIVALAFILGNAFILFTSVHDLITDERLVVHTHEVLSEIDAGFSTLKEAESAQRAYIITTLDMYLQHFHVSSELVSYHLKLLKNMTIDYPLQQKNLSILTKKTNERLALLKNGITARQTTGFDAAAQMLETGRGASKMQEIQSVISDMEKEETRLLKARADQSQISVDELYSAITIALFFEIFFILISFFFIKREFDQRTLSEQRKNDFISIASHELKTPITSMSVFTDLLKKRMGPLKDKQAIHYIQKIREQIQKQTSLINDLLDISKMQAGKIDLHKEPFDIDKLVKETVEVVQTTTKTHKLIIKGRVRNKVFGDKQRIGQVLINFLSNAIKYSPKANRVIITLKKERRTVIVSIQDFGIGIARKHHKKIFTRFYRAREEDQSFPGLGIGLYITFEIIRRHEGKVWVESAAGKGAKFAFTLPIATYI